jgi:hypothetical protein
MWNMPDGWRISWPPSREALLFSHCGELKEALPLETAGDVSFLIDWVIGSMIQYRQSGY